MENSRELCEINISNDLVHAKMNLDLYEQKAFDYSLSRLEYSDEKNSVEIVLDDFLVLSGIQNSLTKEKAANVFRGLSKPLILIKKNETPVPVYKEVQWRGDTVLLEFHPAILTHVLTTHNLMDHFLNFAQKKYGGTWEIHPSIDPDQLNTTTKNNFEADELSDEIKKRIKVFADCGREENKDACVAILKGYEENINVLKPISKKRVILKQIQDYGCLKNVESQPGLKTMCEWIDSYRTTYYPNWNS